MYLRLTELKKKNHRLNLNHMQKWLNAENNMKKRDKNKQDHYLQLSPKTVLASIVQLI